MRNAAALLALALAVSLAGCGDGGGDRDAAAGKASPLAEPCADLSGLTSEQIALRDTFGYVDRSDEPDLVCRTCEFWTEPPTGSPCGGCTLFAGPVHPEGFCDSYSEA